MRSQMAGQTTVPDPEAAPAQSDIVPHELRFGALLDASNWQRLPPAIRERFGKQPHAGASVTYAGQIVESSRTRMGCLVAQLGRLIGAPLPLYDDVCVPAVVTVIEDRATGGQFWTRMYGRGGGFPQIIHSRKSFAGPTGFEEYLGCGFGIALTASADEHALHFHSDHYFVVVGTVRLRLPRWLAPGALTISHIERGGGWFAFVLALRHPWFGEIIRQNGLFRERCVPNDKEKSDD